DEACPRLGGDLVSRKRTLGTRQRPAAAPRGSGLGLFATKSGTCETFTLTACTHPYLKGIKSVFRDMPPRRFRTCERDHVIIYLLKISIARRGVSVNLICSLV